MSDTRPEAATHIRLVCRAPERHSRAVGADALRQYQVAPVCDEPVAGGICGAPIWAVEHVGEPTRYVGRSPHHNWATWADCLPPAPEGRRWGDTQPWRLVGDHAHNPAHPVAVRRYPDLAEPATFVDCWQCRTTWELGRPTPVDDGPPPVPAAARLVGWVRWDGDEYHDYRYATPGVANPAGYWPVWVHNPADPPPGGHSTWRDYTGPGWCQPCSKHRDRVHNGMCHDCAHHYGYLTALEHALVLPTGAEPEPDQPDQPYRDELLDGLRRLLAEPVEPGAEWPELQAGPPPAELQGEQADAERSLVVPYVVCQSQGGPYEDASFVAGAQSAYLHAQLRARDRDRVATWVYPELVPLVDLLAMECGYQVAAEPWADYPDQWVLVTCTRHPRP